ncbi:hypothetical protein GCM10008938_34670 [Deinococcus roseus]|uniref:HEAT repeat domain-containing protein n=1 Tax=Deinococcus roseus TaxID=392414 RepID=A0ABQ2D5I4_9DEIO|nr:hypothetical protein GCM10008938_34670 [Deinococcus roseus]
MHLWIYEAKYHFTVCTWLYSEGSQESTPHLVHVLKQSEDEDARYSACEALTVWGDCRALPALDHAAQHDNGCDYEERPIKEVARKAIEAIQQRYPEEF